MTPVHWMPEALARLDEIHAHIADDAPNAAESLMARILGRTRQLGTAPHSGRRVMDYPQQDLRELLERPYRIVYRVTPRRVEILTVLHYRQLPPARPESFMPQA